MKDNKTELGGIFYPTKDQNGRDVPFDSLYLPYIWKEIYFEGVYLDVLNQQKDLVIADIGANSGLTVKYFRDYAKVIYAVEPDPMHFAALKKNKEFNKWDNVVLCNYALSDKDGTMEFAQSPSNQTTNALVDPKVNKAVGPGWYDTRVQVQTKTFETFMQENKIEEIDFCKFDPEGAEELILYSDSFKRCAPKIKNMMCEFHHADWMNLVKFFEGLGFQGKRYESSAIICLFTRS